LILAVTRETTESVTDHVGDVEVHF
jgi:hypothetical protein